MVQHGPFKYLHSIPPIIKMPLQGCNTRKRIKSKEKALSLNTFNNDLFIHSTQLAARQTCITVTWNETTFRFDLG